MITGTMIPANGMELSFAVETDLDGKTWLILRVGGQRAAKLDDEEQAEFLGHFHGAQLAAAGDPEAL